MKKRIIVALALIAILIAGVTALRLVSATGQLEATSDPKERLALALAQKKPVFIEFYAERCPACVAMKPTIAELKKEYGDRIEFILADTDGSGLELAVEYQVRFIPAYVFINAEGERIGGDLAGYMSKEKLESFLQALL